MRLAEEKAAAKKAEQACCGALFLEEHFVARWPDGSVELPESW